MAAKKSYFETVDPKVDFPKLEEEILAYWNQKGIVKKYLAKNKSSQKYFSFLDGPITANNPMGVHHAWGRTYKDLWQRFKNMQGFRGRFQNGFDCQGLWVEVEVEKELGLKSKKDIENLVSGDRKASIAKFIRLCRDRVKRYSQLQTEQSKRLGYFADWDNSYYTLSENNNYAIWHFLKVCHENGWIYKGNDVVPWCARCQTAISQHEILTEDYKELTHDSIYLELPIVGREREFLLIWTTTPWTIPANTAVAVDANVDYALVKGAAGDKFWVAKDLVESVFKGKHQGVIKTIKGKDLIGLRYRSPFDKLPVIAKTLKESPDRFHIVIATDNLLMPISTAEGTGLVHTSTSTGEEDYKVGKLRGLVVIPAINDAAEYLEGFSELTGQNAKKHPELIFNYLREKETKGEDWIFAIVPYKHMYPACWRCKSELVWKVTDEWYVAMDLPSKLKVKTPASAKAMAGRQKSKLTLRQRMIKVAKKIKWIPEFGLERELDWLANMHDWLISKKNRYWGLALPIWECPQCGNFEVIGSFDELKQKAVSGWDKFAGKTPHKPQIDEIKIKCPKCGEIIPRIEPVGNPWLDAGIVAYSTISEKNQANEFTGRREQPLYFTDKSEWQKWFPADFITESFPGQFKNWFYSLIAMSTVLEDIEPFKVVLGYATLLAEDGRPMHKSWGNSIDFNEGAEKIGVDVMRWLYVRQNPTDNLLFGYKIADETRRRFHLMLWNVYNFFVTYANIDGWEPSKTQNSKLKSQKLSVLDQWILARLDQTISEVTDYLEKFDAYSASGAVESFVNDLSLWFIRRSRDRVGPAAESEGDKEAFYSTCYLSLVTLSKLLAPFTPFIADVIYKNLTKEESVHLVDWPTVNSQLAINNSQLVKQMEEIRKIVERVHAARKEAKIPVRQPLVKAVVQSRSKTEKFEKEILELAKDELNIKDLQFELGGNKVKLDTRITPELEEEARTRELIRHVQEERKRLGMDLTQKIKVTCPWVPLGKFNIQKVMLKTLAVKIDRGEFKIEKNAQG